MSRLLLYRQFREHLTLLISGGRCYFCFFCLIRIQKKYNSRSNDIYSVQNNITEHRYKGNIMNERERRKEELLNELAKRYKDSSDTLKNLAMRIQSAAEESQDNTRIHEDQNQDLRTNIDANQGPLPFSYLEFLEFSSSAEFEKYKKMPVITSTEIETTDLDELIRELQEK